MTQKAAPAPICFGAFTLDPAREELTREGVPIPVEPQVFALIRTLAESGGRLMDRDTLIEAVWGGRIVSDAAISSRIAAARAALGDDGQAQRVIRTVPRRGFRFVAEVHPAAAAEPASRAAPDLPPPTVRYVRTPDGVNLAWSALGSGAPLLKTSSFLTHLEHDHESPVWRHWVQALSARARYIRYDQRGNGLSDREVEEIGFDAFLRDLEWVIDALELEQVTLLGVSQGAALAAAYAARHPERVRGLILVGGYAAGWRRLDDPAWSERREALLRLVPAGWGAETSAFRQVYSSLFFPGGSEELHLWFNRLQQVSATPRTAWRILDALAEFDVRPELARIRTPTLVAHSTGDQIVPFNAGRHLAASIPDAEFMPLESDNHVVQPDDPAWPRLLQAIEGFLDRIGA